MVTIEELSEKLVALYDTELLIEALQIGPVELLERFEDKIELHWVKLEEMIDE